LVKDLLEKKLAQAKKRPRITPNLYKETVPFFMWKDMRVAGYDPETWECPECRNIGIFRTESPPTTYCKCPVGQLYLALVGGKEPQLIKRRGMEVLTRYKDYRIEAFDALPPSILTGKKEAILAAKQWLKEGYVVMGAIYRATGGSPSTMICNGHNQVKSRKKSLIFFGTATGIGKTTLMSHVAWSLMEKGKKFEIVEWRDLISLVQASYANPEQSRDEVLRPFITTPMLFIDDIGDKSRSGRATTDDRSEIMQQIIFGRYNRDLPIIGTTNLMPEHMQKVYGERTAERMHEMVAWVPMGKEKMPSREY